MKLSWRWMNILVVYIVFMSWTRLRTCHGANVLMLPHPFVVSHMRLFYKVAVQLLNQGHQVTVLRWKPLVATKSVVPPPPGCTVIELVGRYSDPAFRTWVLNNIDLILWKEKENYLDYIKFFLSDTASMWKPCVELQEQTEILHQLRHSNISLAIVDPHTYPCGWIFANQLDIPYVALTPSIPIYFVDQGSATPTPFSYVPSIIDGCFDSMTLVQRAKNVFDHHLFSTSIFWKIGQMAIRTLTVWKNVDLSPAFTFYLDNQLLEYARPMTRTHQYLGLKERITQPIKDEMSSFIDSPDSKGTIVLSLSTLGNKEMMSGKMKKTFYTTFQRFPDYRFIWRTSNPPNSKTDGNIIYTKWFNQTNILAQSKTKILITHGGISTVLESVGHGVPMLAMPMGMDHHGNIGRMVNRGIGLRFTKNQLNTQFLTDLLQEMLNNDRYDKRAKTMGAMLDADRTLLNNPMLWWTEYAIRHAHQQDRIKAHGELAPHVTYFHIDIMLVLLGLLVVTADVF